LIYMAYCSILISKIAELHMCGAEWLRTGNLSSFLASGRNASFHKLPCTHLLPKLQKSYYKISTKNYLLQLGKHPCMDLARPASGSTLAPEQLANSYQQSITARNLPALFGKLEKLQPTLTISIV
jgi:hypothetical protein